MNSQMSSIVVDFYHNREDLSLNQIEMFFVSIFGRVYSFEQLLNISNHIWTAFINDRLIGCVLVKEIRSSMFLYVILFGIERIYRSLGIGTRLITILIRFAEKNSFRKIFLHVESSNRRAIDFYRKFHFQIDQSIGNYYKSMSNFDPHAFRMIRLFENEKN